MSKKTVARTATPRSPFQVKPLTVGEVAAVVLEDLSRAYGNICNYQAAADLARSGEIYLAYVSILEHNADYLQRLPQPEALGATEAWVFAQAEGCVKKLVDPGYDRWADTANDWYSTEHKCKRMNQKFAAMYNRKIRGVKPIPFASSLQSIYRAIHFVIGENPPVDEICEAAHYGPGSTVAIRGKDVSYARKLDAYDCTSLSVDLAARALCHDKAAWAHLGFDPAYSHLEEAKEGFIRVARERLKENVVPADRLMFIHKSIKSLRSIGAQPTLSGMLQLGVHEIISRCLLERADVDLADQSWNQELARVGSLEAHINHENPYCTLDKSNASNTVANGIVQLFFPPAWAKLLGRLRTPAYLPPPELYRYKGIPQTYHMYAGMGNGTTFCVETLIFFGMAYACYAEETGCSVEEFVNSKEYAIYGDDVILRRNLARRYVGLAEYLGFTINKSKSYLSGLFRESCGADYHSGINVRAAVLKSEDGFVDMETLIGFHNTLADQPVYKLPNACRRLRALWKARLYPCVPTDPQGQLGFRPTGGYAWYDVVTDKDDNVILSPVWHRPRVYTLDVTTVKKKVEGPVDMHTAFALALLKAKQSGATDWSLPLRKSTTVKVVPERDLIRGDLAQMLANCLVHLKSRKEQPWYKLSRGQTRKDA